MLVYIPGPGPGMAILTAAADAPVELVHCDHAELGHVVAVRGGRVGHNGKHYLAPEALEQIILQSIPATPGWTVRPDSTGGLPARQTPILAWVLTAASPANPIPLTLLGPIHEPEAFWFNGEPVGKAPKAEEHAGDEDAEQDDCIKETEAHSYDKDYAKR